MSCCALHLPRPVVLHIFPTSLAFKPGSQSPSSICLPFFNAKIVFSSLLHFLIPPCFEEKPKETCYSDILTFATWKLCLRVEIQRAPAASLAAKTRSLCAVRERYLTKTMHVFTLYFPKYCQALRAVGKEASFCQLNNWNILLTLADSSTFQIGTDLPRDLVWARCFHGDSPCPAESKLLLLPHSSYSCSEQCLA